MWPARCHVGHPAVRAVADSLPATASTELDARQDHEEEQQQHRNHQSHQGHRPRVHLRVLRLVTWGRRDTTSGRIVPAQAPRRSSAPRPASGTSRRAPCPTSAVGRRAARCGLRSVRGERVAALGLDPVPGSLVAELLHDVTPGQAATPPGRFARIDAARRGRRESRTAPTAAGPPSSRTAPLQGVPVRTASGPQPRRRRGGLMSPGPTEPCRSRRRRGSGLRNGRSMHPKGGGRPLASRGGLLSSGGRRRGGHRSSWAPRLGRNCWRGPVRRRRPAGVAGPRFSAQPPGSRLARPRPARYVDRLALRAREPAAGQPRRPEVASSQSTTLPAIRPYRRTDPHDAGVVPDPRSRPARSPRRRPGPGR